MVLVIGGAYQGKKAFAKERFGLTDAEFADGAQLRSEETIDKRNEASHPAEMPENAGCRLAIYDYHLRVKEQLRAGSQPEEELKKMILAYPEVCIIANEVGSGLIPLERSERDYREAVGRTLCTAAKEADEVWRVTCGIGQRIK